MNIPKHIAIIPDGNRRWAQAQRLKPWEGHVEGVKRVWDITEHASQVGIKYLTIWGGSYKNLKERSEAEVQSLLELLRQELTKPAIRKRLIKNQCNVQLVGEWRDFVTDPTTIAAIDSLQAETAQFDKLFLSLLFAYDGQREMLSAINAVNADHPSNVTDQLLREKLWTSHLPDVDFVIRTGGEPHWSAGFMMWLAANSQLYFTPALWPDFREAQFDEALSDYQARERRLGK